MQFKVKLTRQTSEIGEKPNFGQNFGVSGPNSGPQTFYASYNSTNIETLFQTIMLDNLKEN